MRAFEELLNKLIIDAKGNEIGKVDDVEIGVDSKRVEALVVKGKGLLGKQFQEEKLASLMKRVGITKTEDLLIPFDEVQAIGKYVVLKTTLDQASEPVPQP